MVKKRGLKFSRRQVFSRLEDTSNNVSSNCGGLRKPSSGECPISSELQIADNDDDDDLSSMGRDGKTSRS